MLFRSAFVTCALFVGFIFSSACGATTLTEVKSEVRDSAALAQAITAHVILNGATHIFNGGTPNEGVAHVLQFYLERRIYQVEVSIQSGKRELQIIHHHTNMDFAKLKTPADLVARELTWGPPKIIVEELLVDDNADGNVDMLQQFKRYANGEYRGFTRQERDRGEKAGVEQFLFQDGKIWMEKAKDWRRPTNAEFVDVGSTYDGHLKTITRQLGI